MFGRGFDSRRLHKGRKSAQKECAWFLPFLVSPLCFQYYKERHAFRLLSIKYLEIFFKDKNSISSVAGYFPKNT